MPAALALAALLVPVGSAGAARVTLTPAASGGHRVVSLAGAGFPRNARVRVTVGASRRRHVKADRRGRFRVAVRVPRGQRRLVVRAGRHRVQLTRVVRRRGAVRVSATVVRRSRGVVLTPFRAVAGTTRRVRGWGWPRRARVTARLRGRRLASARVGRRGRFAMRVAPSAPTGRVRIVFRARKRRLTVPLVIVAPSSPPPSGEPAPPPAPEPGPSPAPEPAPAPTPAPPSPPVPATAVIAAAGDVACAPGTPITDTTCRHGPVSDLLVNTGLTAVLPLGDLQYETGALSAFQASYAPTWGRVDAIAFPVPGNQEYESPNAGGYFAYFGSRAGPAPGGYYSYDLGAWHVIALNSNCTVVACGAGSAQADWLQADLAAHPARCQLAYWHHPLFTSTPGARATNMADIWRILHAARVDVVLNGHIHRYERFAPQDADRSADPTGPREFVVGTGGRSHAGAVTSVAPNSQVRDSATFGVLRMTLRTDAYDWRFVPEAGQAFADAGSDGCG